MAREWRPRDARDPRDNRRADSRSRTAARDPHRDDCRDEYREEYRDRVARAAAASWRDAERRRPVDARVAEPRGQRDGHASHGSRREERLEPRRSRSRLGHKSPRADPRGLRYEAPRHAAPRYEAPRQEAPRHEAPRYEAPRHEAARYEAPRYEAPRYEAAQRYEAPRFEREARPQMEPPGGFADDDSVPPIGSSEYSSGSDSRGSSSEEAEGKAQKKEGSKKDDIVHFEWHRGMVLNARYEVAKLLGDGTFGRVLQAHDRREDRQVAIKVIRDVKRYKENAKIEADILVDISGADPQGISRCAIMYDTFTHDQKHYCLVFEPLGVSLYDFLKKNSFRGFWMQDIQSFARQSLKCLKFLHAQLSMAHTDLKPENILLQSADPPRPSYFPREREWEERQSRSKSRSHPTYVRPASSQIKIIDFGNATYEEEHHSSVINTRQYRGPEVVLELGWDERSDLWSLGCIFMELYAGELLFGTHENMEHLALMERIIGPLPSSMLKATAPAVREKYARALPGDSWCLAWPELASAASSERHVRSQRPLRDMAPRPLVDLVGAMLTHDKERRPSATEALRNPFFSVTFED